MLSTTSPMLRWRCPIASVTGCKPIPRPILVARASLARFVGSPVASSLPLGLPSCEVILYAKAMTDENPYLGAYGDENRVTYGQALLSGIDEAVVKSVEGERALGSRAFASTLKMERGRYRVRCGKPGKRARMNL